MEDRRAFLRLAVFGLASTALTTSAAEARPLETKDLSGAPWWLLHPLVPGGAVGLGWSVTRLYPAIQGALTLNLRHEDGRGARVDLSLRDGAPKGPAYTSYIDFIVMDNGNGDAPMDESLGRVLRRLAAVVAENEDKDLGTLAALLPHEVRTFRHAEALAAASGRMTPG